MQSTLQTLYQAFLRSTAVTTDSRNVPAGSIFFALKGEKFNGNGYACETLEKGASYVVVDEGNYPDDERFLEVDNVLQSLQQLASHHRKSLGTPVLAITGTNGKTTTKELMSAVLSTTHNLLFTSGNLNNHIGVPLTLLGLRSDHTLAVVEMGANHPGDIQELVDIAEPNWGIITNVGKAHLEGFGSFEGVVQTKTELYRFLRNQGGKILLHNENTYLKPQAEGIPTVLYGTTPGLFVSGQSLPSADFLRFSWTHQGQSYEVNTALIGDYNLTNALAAIAAGLTFGVSPQNINQALAQYLPTNNRSMFKETANNRLIVDAYNANPSSMQAALQNFNCLESKTPKVVLLGAMGELGADSQAEHQAVVDQLRSYSFDKVYLCGDKYVQTYHQGFRSFHSLNDLLSELNENPLSGYTILIKGSRSMTMERTVELL